LARHTVDESNPYIPSDSPDLQTYLAEHDYAVQWAVANRDLVAHRIKQCVFHPSDNVDGPSSDIPSHIRDLGKIVDVTHNSVTTHSLLLAGERRSVWIHRKGAAPADNGVAPCPGSRGDFSWLLQPIGDGECNGLLTFVSECDETTDSGQSYSSFACSRCGPSVRPQCASRLRIKAPESELGHNGARLRGGVHRP
jgi:RNA-splicing ligase RtcB